jgi:hypothetical protein
LYRQVPKSTCHQGSSAWLELRIEPSAGPRPESAGVKRNRPGRLAAVRGPGSCGLNALFRVTVPVARRGPSRTAATSSLNGLRWTISSRRVTKMGRERVSLMLKYWLMPQVTGDQRGAPARALVQRSRGRARSFGSATTVAPQGKNGGTGTLASVALWSGGRRGGHPSPPGGQAAGYPWAVSSPAGNSSRRKCSWRSSGPAEHEGASLGSAPRSPEGSRGRGLGRRCDVIDL